MTQHEAGLGHGALKGVDQQQGAVGHTQHALDLAAKVGVARSVDDVDLNVLVLDRDVLGENRDAALALWSLESRTRSSTCWLARKASVARRSLSTIVVLPWSTWAMMAMFLRLSTRM